MAYLDKNGLSHLWWKIKTALSGKQDKPTAMAAGIPVTGWDSDSTSVYPHYYDLPVSGITGRDKASVAVAPASLNVAANCGLCPTCETMEDKLRLRAASIPTEVMSIHYWIEKGA